LANRAKLFYGNGLKSSDPVTSLDGFVATSHRICANAACVSARLHFRFNAARTSDVCFSDAMNRRTQTAEGDAVTGIKRLPNNNCGLLAGDASSSSKQLSQFAAV
jgi:hypothetical protein